MVAWARMLDGKRYVLSDHSLSKMDAQRIQRRHKELGLNAQVKRHATGKYAVYRRCGSKINRANPRKRKKQIHVNQFMIRSNLKVPVAERRPPITIQTSKGSIRATNVTMLGDSKVKYTPDQKLSCGASVYIETDDAIELDDCAKME